MCMRYVSIQQTIRYSICKISDIACGPPFWTISVSWYPHQVLVGIIILFLFQGVLDLVANRCLASGTNAWTDTDHTCYTMTNAGSEGFLNLLPVYMDHVLYPTITVSINFDTVGGGIAQVVSHLPLMLGT